MLRKLYRFIKPMMAFIILGMLLKLVGTIGELALPYLLSNMIDIGIVNSDFEYITRLCIIMLCTVAVSFGAGIGSHYLAASTSQKVAKSIREQLYSHIQKLPQGTVDGFSSASLTSRVSSDIERIQGFISSIMRMLVRVSFLTVGGVAMALFIDPYLTAALGGSMVVILFVSSLVYKLTRPIYRKVQDGIDGLSNIVREGLFGIKTIKAFDKYEHESDRFKEKCNDVRKNELKAGRINAVLSPSITVISNIGLVIVLAVSGIRVDGGFLEVGQIIAIVSYINMILNAMVAVPRIFLMFSRSSASAIRINELFDKQPTSQTVDIKPLNVGAQEKIIEFEKVSFTYQGNASKTLRDISFSIRNGETTAIVGQTGCGKTTLINLLVGLYLPNSGAVKLMGRDVSSYTRSELRDKIGVALQQYNIFSMSIEKNIILNKEYDKAKCDEAVRQAQLTEFVDTLDEGLKTHISQAGANLSGGQKQRLNLARIFYKKPEVIILDDVTSALDFKTDYLIRSELKKLNSARAVILVAQRIASIKDCDNILVMKNGAIVAQGKHEVLLADCPEYLSLYNSQQSQEGDFGG